MDYMHVCFALHDERGCYSKYLGIAIMSLFEHTDSKICVHILLDDTVNETQKERFKDLARQYGQNLRFYEIDTSDLVSFKKRVAMLSIGTLFRLRMVETLPSDLQRIIYLDDDLLINMDILELWKTDLTGYVLAACRDPGIPFLKKLPYPCEVGWVPAEDYFNAGVMVIDLSKLRHRKNFAEECVKFLSDNPECFLVDQDVFNVFFKGQVSYLPSYCNMFSRLLRKEADVECTGICHISGDYIDSEQSYWFDRLFFEYWEHSPWSTASELLPYFLVRERWHAKQILLWQKIAEICSEKKRPFVIWGATGIMLERLRYVCPAISKPDWFVDSKIELQGRISDCGVRILSQKTLTNYNGVKPFVLVMSKKYQDIISLLKDYAYQENIDYGNGALLLLQNQGGEFLGY